MLFGISFTLLSKLSINSSTAFEEAEGLGVACGGVYGVGVKMVRLPFLHHFLDLIVSLQALSVFEVAEIF